MRNTSSVRGGSSSSTWALVRRSTNGAIMRRSRWAASRTPLRSIGTAKCSLKRASEPSRPGLQKRMIDHSSASRFSTGVPDSAMRKSARSSNTACERLVAAFLNACASSATTVCHARWQKASRACSSSVYETITTSCGPACSSKAARSPSA